MMKISASFLSIKENLKENVESLDKTSIAYLHLDIMAGKFVTNKTYSIAEINYLLQNTTNPNDVHLMVNDVMKYIDDFITINPEFITFHLEAIDNQREVINYLKQYNIKVGISIKPKTNIETLLPYLPLIDLILIMSVEPGYGGQEFIMETTSKIDNLKYLRDQNNYNYIIQVDGGINNKTIKYCQ